MWLSGGNGDCLNESNATCDGRTPTTNQVCKWKVWAWECIAYHLVTIVIIVTSYPHSTFMRWPIHTSPASRQTANVSLKHLQLISQCARHHHSSLHTDLSDCMTIPSTHGTGFILRSSCIRSQILPFQTLPRVLLPSSACTFRRLTAHTGICPCTF